MPESEARIGGRYAVDGRWSVGTAVGFGIASEGAIGAPAWRWVLDVRYETRPRTDSDRDRPSFT